MKLFVDTDPNNSSETVTGVGLTLEIVPSPENFDINTLTLPDLTIYTPSDTLTPYEEAAFGTTTEDFYGSSNQNDDDDESDGI